MTTPLNDGYRFPAEWEPHVATWLTYPHNEDSFPEKMNDIYKPYLQFISEICRGEKVRINVPQEFVNQFNEQLDFACIDKQQIEIFVRASNDVWCRDHGPAFVVRSATPHKAVIDWEFNAWGGKYPHNHDNLIAREIATDFNLPLYKPGIVMEGGAVEFNGAGTLLTTKACLLNKNRNKHLTQAQIEQYLCDYYGVQQILWLGDGIEGDDTDGHIDDIARFTDKETIVTVVETRKNDINFKPLQENLRLLKTMRLLDNKQATIVELPMPSPVIHQNQRLPASYANFYITNAAVIVPTFRCKEDDRAMQILSECFPTRKIVGIDSVDIVCGFGSFHCLSQQEPV
jgi:agmatine deiminase